MLSVYLEGLNYFNCSGSDHRHIVYRYIKRLVKVGGYLLLFLFTVLRGHLVSRNFRKKCLLKMH